MYSQLTCHPERSISSLL